MKCAICRSGDYGDGQLKQHMVEHGISEEGLRDYLLQLHKKIDELEKKVNI
jgi:truncated hemoglobin YjbI